MPGVYFVVGLLASILILSQCIQRKEWDLIHILNTEKNIRLTEDFSLNLTSSTNYSQFILSAKHIFMSYNLSKPFVVYVKLRIKQIIHSSMVLFTVRDPDNKIRMQMSFKINPGFINKKELNVIFNPISAEGQMSNLNFTLPFTHAEIWTFGLLFDRNQISLYTTCDDIKQPFGFQTEKISTEIDKILFSDGAVLQLFSEDHFTNSLQGEIHEMIFANFIEKLQVICTSNEIEGSGNKFMKIEKKTHGNILLSTEASEEDDTTTLTVSTTESRKDTLSTSRKHNSTILQEIDNLMNKNISLNEMTDSKKEIITSNNEKNLNDKMIKKIATSVKEELNEVTETPKPSKLNEKSTIENISSKTVPISYTSIKSTTFSKNENTISKKSTKKVDLKSFSIPKDDEKIISSSTSKISNEINIETSTSTTTSSASSNGMVSDIMNSNTVGRTTYKTESSEQNDGNMINKITKENSIIPSDFTTEKTVFKNRITKNTLDAINQVINVSNSNSITLNFNGEASTKASISYINTTMSYTNIVISNTNTTTSNKNSTISHKNTTMPYTNTTLLNPSTAILQTNTTVPYTNTIPHKNISIPYTNTTILNLNTTIPQTNTTIPYTSTTISNTKKSTESISTLDSTNLILSTSHSQDFQNNTSTQKSISQTVTSVTDYEKVSELSRHATKYTNVTLSQLYSVTSPFKSSKSTSTLSSSIPHIFSRTQNSIPTISKLIKNFAHSKTTENQIEMNFTTTLKKNEKQLKDLLNNTVTSTSKPNFIIKSDSMEITKENITKTEFPKSTTEMSFTPTTKQTTTKFVSSIKMENLSDFPFTSSQSTESIKRKTTTPSILSDPKNINTSSTSLKISIQTNNTLNSDDKKYNQTLIKKTELPTTLSTDFTSKEIKKNYSMTPKLTTDNLTSSKSFSFPQTTPPKTLQNDSISPISPPKKFSNPFSSPTNSIITNKTIHFFDILRKNLSTTLKPSVVTITEKENQTKSTTYTIQCSSPVSTKLYSEKSKEKESNQQFISKIDTNGNDECKSLSKLRLTIPEKGEKGEKGMKGNVGEKGNIGPPGKDGVCVETACKVTKPIKGDKGDPGKCTVNQCPIVKGEKGSIGFKGEHGIKGEKGDKNSMNIDLIKHLVLSIVKSEMESLNLFRKGEKGDPGICKCDQKTFLQGVPSNDIIEESVNVGHGSLIFETKEALEQVSSRLPAGSLVFVVKTDMFLVKIDQANNMWRTISMETKSKDWILPIPTFPKQEVTQPPYINGFTKRLHLIALLAPTMGDLKPMLRQPGGYSGAAFQCQQAGATYGYGRFLHPFINTDPFQLKFILKSKYTNIPIYNSRGEVLANDYPSLLSENEQLQNEILDFKKEPIFGNILAPCIWIGKEASQNDIEYDKNSESRCINWMSRDPFVNGLALMISSQKSLFDESNKNLRSCSQQCYILCIQTEPYEQ